VKAHVYDEVDLTDWLRGQIEAGCTQLSFRSHNLSMEGRVRGQWSLSANVDVVRLTEEVERAVALARADSPGFNLLGVFSYRPERWTPVGMALFLEGPPL
jgi:hypothetical protein